MKRTALALVLLALAIALPLAGCGNKGDLVRPEPKPDTSSGS